MVTWGLKLWVIWVFPFVKIVQSRLVYFNVCKFCLKNVMGRVKSRGGTDETSMAEC